MNIITWNMQGGSHLDGDKNAELYKFFGSGYDVICLQEATNKLDSFNDEYPFGVFQISRAGHYTTRDHPENLYYCCKYIFGDINTRCSLVTYVKKAIFNSWGTVEYPPSTGRHMLWVMVTLAGGALIRIGNVHLASGAPGLAFSQFRHFREQSMTLGGSYAIVGDFNLPLPELTARVGTVPGLNLAHFHHTGHATHPNSKNILDYVYHTGAVRNGPLINNGLSDHSYYNFEIL